MGTVGEVMKRSGFYFVAKRCNKLVKNIIPGSVRFYIKEKLLEKNINILKRQKENYMPERFREGVNLIGSVRAENGLGQSCRLVAGQLKASDLQFSVFNVNFDANLRESDDSYDEYITDKLPYRINLFHVNPCELGNVSVSMPEAWNGHYNIAFWLWELEEFPKEWVKYCSLFDEIWTPSAFAGYGIKQKTDVPVRTMPYVVTAPVEERYIRENFGLPEDKFLYLVMYDTNSTDGRKNPQGAINAYKRAFPIEKSDHGLVIKINNMQKKNMNKLRRLLSGYQNVYFITEVLGKKEVNSLIKCVDVFVSLHRSEGLGLVLIESMLLGTPVIATNWSSNTEFMDEESSCMVNYKLIKNKKREGPYKKGCIWAEPDIEDTANYMIKLKNDKNYYMEKKIKGMSSIDRKFNKEKLKVLWSESIKVVKNGR